MMLGEDCRRPARGMLGPLVFYAAVLIVAEFAATWAWACVPLARLVSLRPGSSGPPGSHVTVEGVGFDGPPNNIEIRWNDSQGQLLTTATGPNFTVDVEIPASSQGLYGIVVLSRQPEGPIGNAGRAPFQVTGASIPSPVETPGLKRDGAARSSPLFTGWALFGLVAGVAAGLLLVGGVSGVFLSHRGVEGRERSL